MDAKALPEDWHLILKKWLEKEKRLKEHESVPRETKETIMKPGKQYSVEEVGDDTYGIDEIPTEWGRKKLDRKTEKLIQGTEFQVRGRYFNDNDGKGTF